MKLLNFNFLTKQQIKMRMLNLSECICHRNHNHSYLLFVKALYEI